MASLPKFFSLAYVKLLLMVEVVTVEKEELLDLITRTVTHAINEALSPKDRVMNKSEVAKYLRKSPATVTRYMKKKGLPHSNAGRPMFRQSEVDRWLAVS